MFVFKYQKVEINSEDDYVLMNSVNCW